MIEKVCTIKWIKRPESSDIVDICAVSPTGETLFSRSYRGGVNFNSKAVDATFTEVYEWTRKEGYKLDQRK